MRCLMKTKMIKEVDDDRRLGGGAASIFVQAWTLVGGLWPFASGELALQLIRSFQQGTMGTMGTVGKKRCFFLRGMPGWVERWGCRAEIKFNQFLFPGQSAPGPYLGISGHIWVKL